MTRASMVKHTEHFLDKLFHFGCFALVLFVDVLQLTDHLGDFYETILQLILRVSEFGKKPVDIIDRAFSLHTIICGFENLGRLFVGEEDVASGGGSDSSGGLVIVV